MQLIQHLLCSFVLLHFVFLLMEKIVFFVLDG